MSAVSAASPTGSPSWVRAPKRPRYACDKCPAGKGFESPKDLRRHEAIHGGEKYVCSCGKPTTRKDNHLRHVNRARDCSPTPAVAYYKCVCGQRHSALEGHRKHVTKC